MNTDETPPIVFKSYPYFMDQMREGTLTFSWRRHDMADERIYRLSWGSMNHVPDVKEITFVSTDDPEDRVTFEYRGMEFAPWAPGWCMLLLGRNLTQQRVIAAKKVMGFPLDPEEEIAEEL